MGLLRTCEEFCDQIVTYYGLYSDSISGFENNAYQILMLAKKSPAGSETNNKIYYGYSHKDGKYAISYALQGEYVKDNREGGDNYIHAAQQFIVFIYTSWEHKYRKAISGVLDSEGITLPIMGDLRLFRHDILHHHSIIRGKTYKKLEILQKMCKPEEALSLSSKDVSEIVEKMLESIDDLIWSQDIENHEGWSHGLHMDIPID